MPRKYIPTGKPFKKPLEFETPQELYDAINGYFENCPDTVRKAGLDGDMYEIPTPTFAGLLLHLGFAKRSTYYDYGKRADFAWVVDYGRLLIEKQYETMLRSSNCTGAIFALKNFGWKDTQDITIEQKSKSKEEIEAELSRLIGKIIA